MAGFLEKCFEFFKTRNLYEVLEVEQNANGKDVKKAYYRMSLKVHPDRVSESIQELATQKFQILGRVYSILADKDKRAIYDETGSIDEEGDADSVKDWESYWRLLFKKITLDDIERFKKEYQGSNEELKDLKEYYEHFKGDMDKILESLPCADIDEEPRLREILIDCIKRKEILDYNAFTKESAVKRKRRQQKYKKEADEAEEAKRELGLDKSANGGLNGLEAMIAKRQESRGKQAGDFFASLEAKYCGKKTEKKAERQDCKSVKAKSPALPKKTGTKRKR